MLLAAGKWAANKYKESKDKKAKDDKKGGGDVSEPKKDVSEPKDVSDEPKEKQKSVSDGEIKDETFIPITSGVYVVPALENIKSSTE